MRHIKYRRLLTALVVLVAMSIPVPGIAMAKPGGHDIKLTIEQTTKRPPPAKKRGALRVGPQSHQDCTEDRFTTCVYFGIGAEDADGEHSHFNFLLMGLSDPKSMEVTVGFIFLDGWTSIPGMELALELDFNGSENVETSFEALLEEPYMQALALGWPQPGGIWESRVRLDATLTSTEDPKIYDEMSVELNRWQVRCDLMAMEKTVGCVNPWTIPDLTTMGASDIPAIGQHISDKISIGAPQMLTRLQDVHLEEANREESCRDVPIVDGMQCDEYPFASTQEGGTYVGRNVPTYQNRKQGYYMMLFYTGQRVIHGDQFYVDL